MYVGSKQPIMFERWRGSKSQKFVRTLYDTSCAAKFGITLESFSALLLRLQASCPDFRKPDREFYGSLHVEDLVLAHACHLGNNAAWEILVARYEGMLHSAALTLCKSEISARELVASLFGDLFGTALDADGRRRSKLASYTGRGTLAGWLRATLAQTCIDQHRLHRRFISIDEALPLLCRWIPGPDATLGSDARLGPAVEQAIRDLAPELRFLLKAYYLDQMSLTQIGVLVGAHESTISRRLRGIARSLRRSILRSLVKEGMSMPGAQQALKSDVRYVSADIEGALIKTYD
jgi:RNA polymerase sigma-70 factor (ECF subfamily)